MTKSEWHRIFTGRLRRLMNNRCLTLSDLAKMSGVNKKNLYRYLYEGRVPDSISMTNIAIALEINVRMLMDFGDYIVNDPEPIGSDFYDDFRRNFEM